MFSNFSHYLASYFNDGKIKDANSGNSVSTIKAQSDCSKLSCVEDSSDDDLVMVTKPNEYWGDDESNNEDVIEEKYEQIYRNSKKKAVDLAESNVLEGFKCVDNPNQIEYTTNGSMKNTSPIKINFFTLTNITSSQKRKHPLMQDASSENSDFENYRGPYINLHQEIWGDQEILTDASDQPEVLSSPSLEESWLVTPAPCFEKLEPVNVVEGCMEDLLLKGPTVSIYQKFICEKERRLSGDKDLTIRSLKENIESIIKQNAFNDENLSVSMDKNDSCVSCSTLIIENKETDEKIASKFKDFVDVFNNELYGMHHDETEDLNKTPTVIMDFFDKSLSFFKKFYLSLNEKNLENEFCSALSNIYHFLSSNNIGMNKYVQEMIELRKVFVQKDKTILSYIYNMNCKNFSLLIKAVLQGADEALMSSLEDILKFSLSLNSLLGLVLIGPVLNADSSFVFGSKFASHRGDQTLIISNTLNRNNMLQAFLKGRISNEELAALFRKAKPLKRHSKRDAAAVFGFTERQYEKKRYQHYHHPYHSRHQQRAF